MIDKNYAPPGYEAKRPLGLIRPCFGCVFDGLDECLRPNDAKCTQKERPDKTEVIFVKKPPQWEHVGTGAVSILRNAKGRVIEAKIVFE